MGNRTFLSVTEADNVGGTYEFVAFETNNFLAPFWFCLVSGERYRQYRERLLNAWSTARPYMGEEGVEDRPEWQSFCDALDMDIVWSEALAQMRECLPGTLSRYPALGPYMSQWLETLHSHVKELRSPVVHLELAQFFDFYVDPVPYLEAIEEQLAMWSRPGPSSFAGQHGETNGYMLGGEHLNKGDGADDGRQPGGEEPAPPPARKAMTKRKQELYTWLLAVLSAALGLAALVLTANIWLTVFAFLLPSACIVARELIIRPKRKTSTGSVPPPRPAGSDPFVYFDGPSPIRPQGVEAGGADMPTTTVPWPQIKLARAVSPSRIELELYDSSRTSASNIRIELDSRLKTGEVASSIHSIAGLWRNESGCWVK